MSGKKTFDIEDKFMAPFFVKQKVSIERGEGVYVWDEEGNKYIDFTSGWGVTCIGHGQKVITDALNEQSKKIIQNPNSGLTYSPARARLLTLMHSILPSNLTHIFFNNSGAEANDAAIKLARKVTNRMDVISMYQSFHGRTISTASATGQAKHREKFNPLMPNYKFVAYGDIDALSKSLNKDVAAVILEPIQGEGGVNIASDKYLKKVAQICKKNKSLLIADEIQTGFCRTGPMFVFDSIGVNVDFLTMAKGIAGGFPFAAFAMTNDVAKKLELGDHGGTYCGNPLGCAVSYAVINYLIDNKISENVKKMGQFTLGYLNQWKDKYREIITNVRGAGLLLLIEFKDKDVAKKIFDECLKRGLFLTQTQGVGLRIFPALNIRKEEIEEGLSVIKESIEFVIKNKS